MSKPNWGIKRICPSCSMKYYDFDKSPIICPGCNFKFDPDLLLKSRKGRGFSSKSEDLSANENQVSNDAENEDLVPLENEEQILEVEDETQISTENNIDENIDKNLDADIDEQIDEVEDDIPFIEDDMVSEVDEDGIEIEDEDSIEIEDEEDKN